MSSLLALVFGQQKVQIGVGVGGDILPTGALEFDAAIEESHDAEVDVTEFPVEEGADISDHLRPKPEEITINGVISDSPLTLLPVAPNRAGDAYGLLKELKDRGELVSVVTSLRQYENMAIRSVRVLRNAQNGNSMNATVTLREVFTAQTAEIAVPVPAVDVASKKGPTNKGQRSKKDPPSPKASDSMFAAAGKAVGILR